MADFATRWATAQNATFQSRCTVAAVLAAGQYTSEQAESYVVDTKRRELAVKVLNDPPAFGALFAIAVAASEIEAANSDDDVQTRVHQWWDNIAGVRAEDYGMVSS